ncbi:hypothetical protein H0R92_00995 [Treponema sp. OMZ 840]|uniref:hypothetical protein n=1 Tax=Treponema sp. OMZ 840 TaxID=244313 RepID=UPI003D8B63CF
MRHLLYSKKIIIICFFLSLLCYGFAQQNISVPLEDPVYAMLDYAMIRGYCETMHNSRPYTLKTVLDLLNQILDNSESLPKEKTLARETLERLTPKSVGLPLKQKSPASVLLKNGSYTWESTAKLPVRIHIGGSWESSFNTNFNSPDLSSIHWFDMYIKGDIGNNFSYNVNAGMGIMKLDIAPASSGEADSHAPNTFSQSWDGYQYLMQNLATFDGLSNSPAAGIRLLPEFAVRLWDGKAGINFSRMRRDWGTGDGNLILSKTARPFAAVDVYIRPFPWISLSALTGSLEYFNSKGIQSSAKEFQNNISAFMAELFIKDIAYIGFTSSAVWVKRFELGYLNPGMIPFFYQNMIGDFDNLQLGFAVGFNIPKYAKLYYNLFIDEAILNDDNFFHNPRASMLIWQTGSKLTIPEIPFTTFLFQYTKIERYMYTHPLENVPGYNTPMNTSYINHGEPLGYKLKPNSDELKITVQTLPFWYLNIQGFYTLVHHGVDYGSKKIPGSSYGAGYKEMWTPEADANPTLYRYKDFLKDGVYEWIHSLGISADLNLRFVKDIPLKLRMGYTLSYTHHTEFVNGKFMQERTGEYKNRFGNYLSLSIKVY